MLPSVSNRVRKFYHSAYVRRSSRSPPAIFGSDSKFSPIGRWEFARAFRSVFRHFRLTVVPGDESRSAAARTNLSGSREMDKEKATNKKYCIIISFFLFSPANYFPFKVYLRAKACQKARDFMVLFFKVYYFRFFSSKYFLLLRPSCYRYCSFFCGLDTIWKRQCEDLSDECNRSVLFDSSPWRCPSRFRRTDRIQNLRPKVHSRRLRNIRPLLAFGRLL